MRNVVTLVSMARDEKVRGKIAKINKVVKLYAKTGIVRIDSIFLQRDPIARCYMVFTPNDRHVNALVEILLQIAWTYPQEVKVLVWEIEPNTSITYHWDTLTTAPVKSVSTSPLLEFLT